MLRHIVADLFGACCSSSQQRVSRVLSPRSFGTAIPTPSLISSPASRKQPLQLPESTTSQSKRNAPLPAHTQPLPARRPPPAPRGAADQAAPNAPTAQEEEGGRITIQEWVDLTSGYTSARYERSGWIDAAAIEGTLPPELHGTLLRNGPGIFEVGGKRLPQPFDGDGLVAALSFVDGRVFFANRFVRTEGESCGWGWGGRRVCVCVCGGGGGGAGGWAPIQPPHTPPRGWLGRDHCPPLPSCEAGCMLYLTLRLALTLYPNRTPLSPQCRVCARAGCRAHAVLRRLWRGQPRGRRALQPIRYLCERSCQHGCGALGRQDSGAVRGAVILCCVLCCVLCCMLWCVLRNGGASAGTVRGERCAAWRGVAWVGCLCGLCGCQGTKGSRDRMMDTRLLLPLPNK